MAIKRKNDSANTRFNEEKVILTMPISEVTNEDCMVMTSRYPDKKKYILSPEQRTRKTELQRLRYQDNISACRDKQNARRLANKDRYNKYRNDYRTKNPSGIFDVMKQSAKKRNILFDLIRKDFINWYNLQERICIYCKRQESEILKDVDIIQSIARRLSIDRLRNEDGYLLNNIGLCCRRCNTIKGSFFTFDEMIIIGQIIANKYANK